MGFKTGGHGGNHGLDERDVWQETNIVDMAERVG